MTCTYDVFHQKGLLCECFWRKFLKIKHYKSISDAAHQRGGDFATMLFKEIDKFMHEKIKSIKR